MKEFWRAILTELANKVPGRSNDTSLKKYLDVRRIHDRCRSALAEYKEFARRSENKLGMLRGQMLVTKRSMQMTSKHRKLQTLSFK